MSLAWNTTKAGCGGGFEMDSKRCGCAGKLLSSLDICHHPDAG